MGQFRNTDTWTKEQKAARVEAMLSSPGRIIYDLERAALNELALSRSTRWLLEWGYSTPKILESLVGRSCRFARQLLKQKIVATTPRVVHSRDKSHAQIGIYVKAIRLVQLMPHARESFIDRHKPIELIPFDDDDDDDDNKYSRSNRIDRPELLRHNLLVQRVSAELSKHLATVGLEATCYSPRTLRNFRALPKDKLNLGSSKYQPDSVLCIDVGPFYRSETGMSQIPWLEGKLGYCVEVELSEKTDGEIKKFADKILELQKYFSVVLVTERRRAMDILLDRLSRYLHPDTDEPISNMVRPVVIEEVFPEKDPF